MLNSRGPGLLFSTRDHRATGWFSLKLPQRRPWASPAPPATPSTAQIPEGRHQPRGPLRAGEEPEPSRRRERRRLPQGAPTRAQPLPEPAGGRLQWHSLQFPNSAELHVHGQTVDMRGRAKAGNSHFTVEPRNWARDGGGEGNPQHRTRSSAPRLVPARTAGPLPTEEGGLNQVAGHLGTS